MKELNPSKLTMEDAAAAMNPVIHRPHLTSMDAMNAIRPPDPEREAFDKWWDKKSSEPLNYKDIKHYAWSAWIESRHHTVAAIKEKVEKL